MNRHKNSWLSGGVLLLLVFLGSLFVGSEVQAARYSYNFTYSGDSLLACLVGQKVEFLSKITNTGTDTDSFYVALYEYPSTPEDWWREYCAGPFCGDSTTTLISIKLNPSEVGPVILDAIPRSVGQGEWKITVQSKHGGSTKSLDFYLTGRQGPVTSEWGMIILILLFIITAMYLMNRKLGWVKQN
jgi:uncharacterized membrane protein